jgi:hypothetical protein
MTTGESEPRGRPSASDVAAVAPPLGEVGHPAGRSLTQLDNSQQAIRDTTKWLVAAAAAVGGVVVAGLQLSKLPEGRWATAMALFGFVIALGGVAAVIFSAAGVLSGGFTTLGQLADLYDSETPRLKNEERWASRIRAADRIAEEPLPSGTRRLVAIPRRVWGRILSLTLRGMRTVHIRYEKREGVRIADLIRYLERDALIFSSGLAAHIPELYGRLRETEDEVIDLRRDTPAQVTLDARADNRPAATASAADDSSAADKSKAGLEEAAWRLAVLETAAGTLIAFANQKIIERKFGALKWSVRIGGILVAVGVGLFVVAPKVAEPRAVTVNKPTAVTLIAKPGKKFGSDCDAARLAGVAVGGTFAEPIVLTSGTSDCPARRITVTASTGYAVPRTGDSSSP